MNILNGLSIIMLAASVWILATRMQDNDMKVCQLTHSYDTCFSTLNR